MYTKKQNKYNYNNNYNYNKTNKPKSVTKKSYGIICTRFNTNNNKVEFLLIKKRNTYFYVEFVLKCQLSSYIQDDKKLIYLFNRMTHEEKIDILSFDYGKMWYRIWLVNPDSPYTLEKDKLTADRYERYLLCKNNFEKNYLNDNGKKLQRLISQSKNVECLWELPKGRKSFSQEKDIVCAIREFEEETNISNVNYNILDYEPYTLINTALNVTYYSYYYLAYTDFNIINQNNNQNDTKSYFSVKYPKINYNNSHQICEVADIAWLDLDKIKTLDNNNILSNLCTTINKILRKKYKIKKISECGFNLL